MYIFPKEPQKVGFLDEIRLSRGSDKLIEIFRDLVIKNPNQAVKLLNDENIRFSSLFILEPEIKISGLYTFLNIRNKYALEITDDVLTKETSESRRLSSEYRQDNYYVLKWILKTGFVDDSLNDQYEEVMETAAIILAKVYKDKSCMQYIEEMIFKRYRRGAFIYDLVWAFFEASGPENLIMIINRLRSSNLKDIELARKFLNFVPCIGMNVEEDPMKQFQCCVDWLYQNQKFLYYTGETCLQTSNPCRYAVSLEAKYLQKNAADVQDEPSRALTYGEYNYLDNFRKLDYNSKLYLSDYSDILYRKSSYMWSNWLQNPIDKQIEIAMRILGGGA